jgi:hypothetical protein
LPSGKSVATRTATSRRGEAREGEAVLAADDELEPDVELLDIHLSDLDDL